MRVHCYCLCFAPAHKQESEAERSLSRAERQRRASVSERPLTGERASYLFPSAGAKQCLSLCLRVCILGRAGRGWFGLVFRICINVLAIGRQWFYASATKGLGILR